MKYIYLILLMGLSFFATAQQGKGVGASAEMGQVKVVKFYPNPATTFIYFELVQRPQTSYTLQLFNLAGKKVYEAPEISQKTTIPVSDFFRGVYIYQLRDRTGKIVESGKFQVK
jgi:hypothetical protein